MKSIAYKFYLALLLICAITSSCSNDFVPNVDPSVLPYLDRFAAEAALRGVEFDNEEEQIEFYVVSDNRTGNGDILGFCSPAAVRNPIRSISLNRTFWESATDFQKEYLIFHELGHCFLNREHPSPHPIDGNGNCLSIMTAGNAPCNGIDIYGTDNRDVLLDELFSN